MCACKDKACADRTSLSESRKKGGANSTNGSGPSRSRK
jgi:hypothetical protein